MPLPPAAVELLTALSKVLAGRGRWYVFGAQAVIAYGVPRLSADVDVTVKLEPDDPQRFASAMKAAGFVLRVEDPEFIRRTRVMPFVHSATGMPLDIVLAGSGLEDEFLERARAVDLGGTNVPLIALQDLVIAKAPREPALRISQMRRACDASTGTPGSRRSPSPPASRPAPPATPVAGRGNGDPTNSGGFTI